MIVNWKHIKSSVGYIQFHAAINSQLKGEIKAINNETAKTGRRYDNFRIIFYSLEPENSIQSGDAEYRGTGFLYSYTLVFGLVRGSYRKS